MEPKPAVPAPQDCIVKLDIPLDRLTPVRKRTAPARVFARLEANIRAVGLIESLLVYTEKGQHFILDGYLRFLVLKDMGVMVAPCIVIDTLDLYTPNRQVNYLSRSQYRVMINRALEIVPEDQLKAALGVDRFQRTLAPSHHESLCPEVIRRVNEDLLPLNAAKHLIHVDFVRQREILELIDKANDSSGPFIRTQILKTKQDQRVQRSDKSSPWTRSAVTRQKLVDRLVEAEQRHDFFQTVYQQYAADLVKLAIFVRQMVSVREIRDNLAKHHDEELKLFRKIISQYGDSETARN
jgi:hypothetical protein